MPGKSRYFPGARRLYGRQWRNRALSYLRTHPVCERCRTAPATEVHHLIPVKRIRQSIVPDAYLQALCHTCHMQIEHGRPKGAQPDGTPSDPDHHWHRTD